MLFVLNFKIWNVKKPIISILGNNDKEMLLLFDLSNYIERQYSLMFVYHSKVGNNFDEKNFKNYLISVFFFNYNDYSIIKIFIV